MYIGTGVFFVGQVSLPKIYWDFTSPGTSLFSLDKTLGRLTRMDPNSALQVWTVLVMTPVPGNALSREGMMVKTWLEENLWAMKKKLPSGKQT